MHVQDQAPGYLTLSTSSHHLSRFESYYHYHYGNIFNFS